MVTKSKRIFYFDALRALAIVSVIVIHVYALFVPLIFSQYAVIPSFQWIYTQVLGNAFRIGVDLFLMLSGALSLGVSGISNHFWEKEFQDLFHHFCFGDFS